MRAWLAFTKKEFQEAWRSGKLVLFFLIFLLFGIMSPAIAKLTPWLLETMAGSMADSGMIITMAQPDAASSWAQFYKNSPMALVVFLLLFGGCLTAEYQKNTLVPMLTKGLARWKVLAAKLTALLALWTAGYWLMFGVFWGYTYYFWQNGDVQYSLFAAFCVFLPGVWMTALLLLGSVVGKSAMAALGTAGFGFLASYLLSLIPRLSVYLPTRLLSSAALLTGEAAPGDFAGAVVTTVVLSVLFAAAAKFVFDRKQDFYV